MDVLAFLTYAYGQAEASRNGTVGGFGCCGAGGSLTGGGKARSGGGRVGPGLGEDCGQKEGSLAGEENKESAK